MKSLTRRLGRVGILVLKIYCSKINYLERPNRLIQGKIYPSDFFFFVYFYFLNFGRGVRMT